MYKLKIIYFQDINHLLINFKCFSNKFSMLKYFEFLFKKLLKIFDPLNLKRTSFEFFNSAPLQVHGASLEFINSANLQIQ